MKILQKIKRSLGNKSGLTLMETMMAMFILMMATSVVAAGVPTAVSAYQRVVHSANAQVLISTTMTKLRDELGTAKDITVGSDNTTINYTNEAESRSRIYLDANRIRIWEYVDYAKVNDGEDEADEEAKEKAKQKWARENNYDRLFVSDKASNTDINNNTPDLFVTYGRVSYSDGVIVFNNLKVLYQDSAVVEIPTYKVMVLNDF